MNFWWLLWPGLMGLVVGGCIFEGDWGPKTNVQIGIASVLFVSGELVTALANQKYIASGGVELLGTLLFVLILAGLAYLSATLVTNTVVSLVKKFSCWYNWLS